MKIHFPSNLYRYASITLAGTLTTGAILFSPDLQTFASSQNSLTASHSDANRDDSTLPHISAFSYSIRRWTQFLRRPGWGQWNNRYSIRCNLIRCAINVPLPPLTLFLLRQMRPQNRTPQNASPDRTQIWPYGRQRGRNQSAGSHSGLWRHLCDAGME